MSEETKKGGFQDLVNQMPTVVRVDVFDTERGCGFVVYFSEKGFGFGQITFWLDKVTGEFCGDREGLSPEHVGKFLMMLVGSDVKKDGPP